MSVALPFGSTAGSEPLPVIYVLDPAFNFLTTTAATAWLATASRLAGGDFPPTVVVGVGYPTDDLGAIMARRARDLTPTDGRAPEGLSLPPFPLGLGGAARFLDALVSEVMPQVEASHPADPADRTLVGHSFGGLFGAGHALSPAGRVPPLPDHQPLTVVGRPGHSAPRAGLGRQPRQPAGAPVHRRRRPRAGDRRRLEERGLSRRGDRSRPPGRQLPRAVHPARRPTVSGPQPGVRRPRRRIPPHGRSRRDHPRTDLALLRQHCRRR